MSSYSLGPFLMALIDAPFCGCHYISASKKVADSLAAAS